MTENILIVIGALVLLLVLFSIPLLIQSWRTVKRMEQTLEIVNRDLPVIMKNLEEITTNVNRTTTTVRYEVAELSMTLRRVHGIVGLFLGVTDVLRRRMSFPLAGTMATAVAAFKGVRTFIDVFRGGARSDSGDRG
jgi:uncharacterized protein YoxC